MNAQDKYMDEAEYEDYLNNAYGEVEICGMKFNAGSALLELDPIAFSLGLSAMEPIWECGECGAEYDTEKEAEECCKEY